MLLAAGQPERRDGTSFSWCATGAKAEGADAAGVAVVFAEDGEAELIASTAAGTGKTPDAKNLAPRLFVDTQGAGGDRIWAYRNGKLQFTAVADPGLAGDASRVRAALRASSLQ